MKYIITGDKGLIGNFLDKRLQAEGHKKVLGIDKRSGNDIRDIENMVINEPVDVLFHLAAFCKINQSISSPEECHKHNCEGTFSVFEFCRKNNIKKIVFFSSSRVLNKERNPYTSAKLYGEELCKAYQECYGMDYPKNGYEVIVVDNGSRKESVEIIEKKCPKVKLIKIEKNQGFPKPNNVGARVAKGNILMILNNDTIVEKDWLKEMMIAYKKLEKPGILQPKIVFEFNKEIRRGRLNTAGGGMTKFGLQYLIGKGKPLNEYNQESEIFWASGCCSMVDKSLFLDVGGFDESFFLYNEDLDLSWKIRNKEFNNYYVPRAVIYHKAGASTKTVVKNKKRNSPSYYYYQNRNIFRTIKKNCPNKYYFSMMFWRFIINLVQAFMFLLKGRPNVSWNVLKGTFSGFFKSKRNKDKGFRKDGFEGFGRTFTEAFGKINYHLGKK